MTFVDDGRLRLDDPVSDYLPGFDGAKQAITVRMLLSHTHGLVSPGCEGNPTTTLAACAQEVGDGPAPAWRPGSEFHYGGTGFVVAGAIVEQLNGTSFERAFEQRIAEPVGMGTTAFDESVSDRGRHRKALTRNPARGVGGVDHRRLRAVRGDARGRRHGCRSPGAERGVGGGDRARPGGRDRTGGDGAVQITGIPTYGLGVWRDEVSSSDAIRVVSGSGALGLLPLDRPGPRHVRHRRGARRERARDAVPLSQRIAAGAGPWPRPPRPPEPPPARGRLAPWSTTSSSRNGCAN